MNPDDHKKIESQQCLKNAIIDANINRVSEGLRVVEDWARFYFRDIELTEKLRQMRHSLWKRVRGEYPEIIKGRNTGEDILAEKKESMRKSIDDIPQASFNRIKEGLRVLEEMGKLLTEDCSAAFKKMRFKIYDIEKEFYERSN